jgi:hypothetical protein
VVAVQLSVVGDALTISVEEPSKSVDASNGEETSSEPSEEPKKEDEKRSRVLRRQERTVDYDDRVIRMPKSADMERIDAQSINGVLMISIPKKDDAVTKRRTITIN